MAQDFSKHQSSSLLTPSFSFDHLNEITFEDVLKRLRDEPHPTRGSYRAMYSSWFRGITRDPQLMVIPIDDHGFHRGDAVFEAIKCEGGRIYALDRHLERLKRSADRIEMNLRYSIDEMRAISLAVTRASGLQDALLRLFATRGPGGFTTNPYECIEPQFYLVACVFKAVAPEKYENGVSVKVSSYAVKEGFFATVKSCNYLPNVLMKKEALDGGVDFTVSRDEQGYLAEGSTENFAIIDERGEFVVPGFDRTLRGVTAVRMMELAEKMVASGVVSNVRNGHVTLGDVARAKEAMMLGTTLDVLPVTTFEGRPIGDGRVGPITKAFLTSLRTDLASGPLSLSLA
jgi:branched-subunit amino acid aminotransferase/4-amino-4-deoxychorismate lyase